MRQTRRGDSGSGWVSEPAASKEVMVAQTLSISDFGHRHATVSPMKAWFNILSRRMPEAACE
jgi:hypothetical protein